ncbi:hypothetical protein [uncultured Cohaesibacter sp.]|uniref:hypothetical protein n=1 Tax=uncultured Cohaesibacter sp. TaxID=1002546 RepID=UPI0029C882E6|nr:hypothetical protein [uncultured Cohaesibacter sp.]
MKLTAIALPILVAFTVYQPAQAQDYGRSYGRDYTPYYGQDYGRNHWQDSNRYYQVYQSGHYTQPPLGRDLNKKAEKPQSTREVTRQKSVERKVIRNESGKKTVIQKTVTQRKVVKKTVIEPPKQRALSSHELIRIAERNGYRDIRDFSQRGKIASMKARDRYGRLYSLEINAYTGSFVKQTALSRRDEHRNWGGYHRSADRYYGGYERSYNRPMDNSGVSFILQLNSLLQTGQGRWSY